MMITMMMMMMMMNNCRIKIIIIECCYFPQDHNRDEMAHKMLQLILFASVLHMVALSYVYWNNECPLHVADEMEKQAMKQTKRGKS